jgi:small nuclear ribonucleoprotein (snRNP)-like protein
MDRKIFLHVQGGRSVSGVLRGFDIFLNLVLDQATEELGGGQKRPCGMIVSVSLYFNTGHRFEEDKCRSKQVDLEDVLEEGKMDFQEEADNQVIRGNSVASIELLDSMRV